MLCGQVFLLVLELWNRVWLGQLSLYPLFPRTFFSYHFNQWCFRFLKEIFEPLFSLSLTSSISILFIKEIFWLKNVMPGPSLFLSDLPRTEDLLVLFFIIHFFGWVRIDEWCSAIQLLIVGIIIIFYILHKLPARLTSCVDFWKAISNRQLSLRILVPSWKHLILAD
jgi:hypothetical protein